MKFDSREMTCVGKEINIDYAAMAKNLTEMKSNCAEVNFADTEMNCVGTEIDFVDEEMT